MKEIIATVEIKLILNENETFEEAADRLYDLLFDGVCRHANADFWIKNEAASERMMCEVFYDNNTGC